MISILSTSEFNIMYIETSNLEFPTDNTVVELSIELKELQSRFKELILWDALNPDSRAVFIQMNKVECQLNALLWDKALISE
jgi:hypothetical protein